MNKFTAIGRVIGPAEQNGQIKIQTRDNTNSRIGEYVIYKSLINGHERNVFATITARRIKSTIPSNFLSNVDVGAGEISEALGIENITDRIEYELTAKVLGYFDEKFKCFINPRINPNPNTLVEMAPNELLTQALFSKEKGEVGSALIGNLLLRNEIEVIIDVNEMVSTHLAILAGTGSGKSYLTRVILEEMLKSHNRAAIAVFDPHGEYESLKSLSNNPNFKDGDYIPQVKVYIPGDNLFVPFSDLSLGDIKFLLKDITEKMAQLLEEIYDEAGKRAKIRKQKLSYFDLAAELDIKEASLQEGSGYKSTFEALRWRLEKRFNPRGNRPKIFPETGNIGLRDLFQPGQCTVIKLDGLEEDEQQVISAILLRKVYDSRERYVRERLMEDTKNTLEYPVFVVMEEAHRFAPSGDADGISTKILKTILSEGRKFGVGVGLITQRPGKLDQNVLSQCMTQFLMRIINPTDQETIAKSVESAGRELLEELPSLSRGQAIVSGVATRTPVLFKVRESISKHEGSSAKSATEWIKFSQPNKREERELEKATLSTKPSEKDIWESLN
jgi:DNA helicase HerA-like ATPase